MAAEQPDVDLQALGDDELLQRARGGDVEAFAAILARHAPWLSGRARELWKVQGASRSANDWVVTVQRRALADFRQRHTEIRSLRGWLLTILRHAVIDATRRRHSRPEEVTWTEALFAAPAEDAAGAAAARGEQLAMARHHIARLSPQDRTILEWSFHDALPDKDIAARLGMKAEAVKKRRQRALRAVREAIGTSSSEAAEQSE